MKVYIASKYLAHETENKAIFNGLIEAGIDAFLPKSINIDAISLEEMLVVSEKCFNEMDSCNIILIVEPYGKSVSCEIGYAIYIKRKLHQKIQLIRYISSHFTNADEYSEAMITPYIDHTVYSVQELVKLLKCEESFEL